MHVANPRRGGLWLLGAAALLAGCGSANSFLVPIAGGQKTEVAYSKNGMAMSEDDEVRIVADHLVIAKDNKHGGFDLAFAVKDGFVPRTVKVEDVTEDPVLPVCEDLHPRLVKGVWRGPETMHDLKDPTLKWIFDLDDTLQVMRFTITGVDGRVAVLDQPAAYPGMIKMGIRHVLGLNY